MTALDRVLPVLVRWWENPLLHHARYSKPLPLSLLRIAVPVLALIGIILSVLAWWMAWRVIGAVLIALSLGMAAVPVLEAPVASSNRIAHQMQTREHDPRQLVDLDPRDVAWGLALVTLWKVRWSIILGLALTPTLMIGILRASVSDFRTWQESAEVLGDATAAGRTPYLRPDGEIPYFRLTLHAVSAGLLPWALLPLFAVIGVTAALMLGDPLLSNLAALIGSVLVLLITLPLWAFLARTPLLSEQWEVLRAVLMLLQMMALWFGAAWLTHTNAHLVIYNNSDGV